MLTHKQIIQRIAELDLLINSAQIQIGDLEKLMERDKKEREGLEMELTKRNLLGVNVVSKQWMPTYNP